MLRFVRLALWSAAAGFLLLAQPAWADSQQDRAREAVESGRVKPLKAILKAVRKQVDGRVLDAELLEYGGVWIYRLRVLTKDGQVLDIGVDGQSGRILGDGG